MAMSRQGHAQAARLRVDPSAAPATHLVNAQEVRKRLGLVPEFQDFAGIEAMKVAVLDYGFEGAGTGRSYLPENRVLVEHYDPQFVRRFHLGDPEYKKPLEPGNIHGRILAQIIWAVTGNHPGGPQFYLLNASGPTMLRRAVRYAVEQKVDVILFSGSFEGGGNGDGRGPINAIVDLALGANILWINAAGNYGRRVYNGPVRILPDGYLRLRNASDVAALRFRNHVDENTVTITLTWNDYRDEEDAGTDKDLDAYVEDWAGRRIGAGEKHQVSGARAAGPDESRNPRERIVLTNLPASPGVVADPDYTYRIRVRAKSGRFTAGDRLRILVTAERDYYLAPEADGPKEAVEFLEATGQGELYPPADHPLVLTVGDASPDSAIGPTADRRIKPDVILEDSRTYFSDGLVSAGSSNAAAYLAGVAALLKAAEPRLRMRHLLLLAHQCPAVARVPAASRAPAAAATSPAPALRIQGLRVWETPTRARLTATVREGR
jgi:subtilisin family serine protease